MAKKEAEVNILMADLLAVFNFVDAVAYAVAREDLDGLAAAADQEVVPVREVREAARLVLEHRVAEHLASRFERCGCPGSGTEHV